MSDSSSPVQVTGYHAHVYFNSTTRSAAERLREAILGKFAVADHSTNALWLGIPVTMRLERLSPAYGRELLPNT